MSSGFEHLEHVIRMSNSDFDRLLETMKKTIFSKKDNNNKLLTPTRDDFGIMLLNALDELKLSPADVLTNHKQLKSKEFSKRYKSLIQKCKFLDSKTVINGNTKKQKEGVEIALSKSLDELPDGYGFTSQQHQAYKKYKDNINLGKCLPNDISLSDIFRISGTPVTRKAQIELQSLMSEESDVLERISEGVSRSKTSVIWKQKVEEAIDFIKSKSIDELDLMNIFTQYCKLGGYRPTKPQIDLARYFLRSMVRNESSSILLESPTGTGKTFGIILAIKMIIEYKTLNPDRRLPIVFVSHHSLPVQSQIEQDLVKGDIPFVFFDLENKCIEGKQEQCFVVKFNHETIGRFNIRYVISEDKLVYRLEPTQSFNEDGLNVFEDMLKYVSEGRISGRKRTRSVFPYAISVRTKLRNYGLDIVMKMAEEFSANNNYLRPILIADDLGCNAEIEPAFFESIIHYPIVVMTATPPPLTYLNAEREKHGESPVVSTGASSDTIGEGITLSTDGSSIFTGYLKTDVFDTQSFPQTTISQTQLYSLGVHDNELEFRNRVIDAAINGQGLNTLRNEAVKTLSQMTSEEISSIKFPGIKVPLQGATLRIFNNEEEVHKYIKIEYNIEEYERKIKSLISSFKTALTEYKKYEKDLKAQIETGDDNTREAAQLELSSSSFTFSNEYFSSSHMLPINMIMNTYELGTKVGIKLEELFLFFKERILIITENTSAMWYMRMLPYANIILGDKKTTGSGINFPNLKYVYLPDGELTPEEVVQYCGRAGRPKQGSGIVRLSEEQCMRAIDTELIGRPWNEKFTMYTSQKFN